MHIIAGNHDTAYKNTNFVNSLALLLGEYKENIHVYDDDPKELTFDKLRVIMVPWITPENSIKIGKSIKKSKADYVMGHFEIVGFPMSGGELCKHGLDAAMFNNFEYVFSGHFHDPSEKGNVKYLGSPYQMDWSDYGSERGFYIIDSQTRDLEFIKNTYNLFEIIEYDDENATVKDLESLDSKIYKDTFIKIEAKKVTNPALLNKFVEKIESFDAADVKVKDVPVYRVATDDEKEEMYEGVVEDTHTMVSNYVDKQQMEDDMKEAVKSKFMELYKRCEKLT